MAEALNKLINAFSSHDENELNDMMACGLKPLADAMNVNRIVLYYLITNDGEPQVQQTYDWDSTEGKTKSFVRVVPNNQVVAKWLMTVTNDLGCTKKRSELSADELSFMDAFGIQSLFIVPIYSQGKLWGGITFQDCVNERNFDDGCRDLYLSVARLCAGVIIRAKRAQSANDTLKALRQREKSIEILLKIAIVFFSRSESLPDDMMGAGIDLITEMVNIDRLSVWHHYRSPQGLLASQVFRWDKDAGGITEPLPTLQDLDCAQLGPKIEEFLSQGEPVTCPSALLPDATLLHSFGVKSACFVPVLVGNLPWGFVVFADSRVEQHFDAISADLMQAAAFMIANAVVRAEMEREIASKNEVNRIMFESAPIGLCLFDENYKFTNCNDKILEILDTTKQHFLEHFYDLSPKYQPDGSVSQEKSLFLMKQALAGKKQAVEWMHCTAAGTPVPCELTLARIESKDGYVGMGFVYDLRSVKYLEQELDSAIVKSYSDAITGIHNRWFFEDNIKRVLKWLSRSGGPLSLLMIDIDYFKKYNDTYGHLEGDKCLALVAKAIEGTITRASDLVARYGGEEFVVVLPQTDENGAREVARKLQESIQKCNIPHAGSSIADRITVSIGCATGDVKRNQCEQDYIKCADKMLYASKQNGRNQSSFCTVETAPPDQNTT